MRVNEIFYSLQGEGRFTGTAAVFLRFSGCNLKCDFCDTDHSRYHKMTVDEIVKEISRFPARHLVITGGEPALQITSELIDAIKEAGFFIQIETNGIIDLPYDNVWITCSPKPDGKVKLSRIDELKIVYQDQDVEQIAENLPQASYYYLQPLSCSNTSEVVYYILTHPRWKLSLQTHKLINIQ